MSQDQDTLNLASLVEREAKTDPDRAIIAGILWKRLRAGWPLQIDATVQFASANKNCPGNPNCDWWVPPYDTKLPSVYNTYIRAGLPPGPICSPGLAAITAAKNPQTSSYWYYITGSDGITYYARDLREHQSNIDKHLKP